MPTAIDDALDDARVDEIVTGGRLAVVFVEMRGSTKIYAASYAPPGEGALY
jgi:hypothetical protein